VEAAESKERLDVALRSPRWTYVALFLSEEQCHAARCVTCMALRGPTWDWDLSKPVQRGRWYSRGMRTAWKPCDKLTASDFNASPVWGFDLASEGKPEGADETWVRPYSFSRVPDTSDLLFVQSEGQSPAAESSSTG